MKIPKHIVLAQQLYKEELGVQIYSETHTRIHIYRKGLRGSAGNSNQKTEVIKYNIKKDGYASDMRRKKDNPVSENSVHNAVP